MGQFRDDWRRRTSHLVTILTSSSSPEVTQKCRISSLAIFPTTCQVIWYLSLTCTSVWSLLLANLATFHSVSFGCDGLFFGQRNLHETMINGKVAVICAWQYKWPESVRFCEYHGLILWEIHARLAFKLLLSGKKIKWRRTTAVPCFQMHTSSRCILVTRVLSENGISEKMSRAISVTLSPSCVNNFPKCLRSMCWEVETGGWKGDHCWWYCYWNWNWCCCWYV